MCGKRSGAVKSIPVFIAVAILMAIVGAFGSKAVFDAFSKRNELRRAEKQSAQGVIEAVESMTEGKEVSGAREFPDTPQGRLTKMVYELVLSEQARQKKLEQDLQDIGWDWVMTPESLRTKASLQESLKRLAKARSAMKRYSGELEHAWSAMLVKMAVEAKGSSQARDYVAGFKHSSSKPGGGLYFAKRTSEKLAENHAGLEASLRFLLARSGKYTVNADGAIDFGPSVSSKEREAYDALIDKVNASLEEVQRLEELRLKTARERIDQAKDYLK